MTSREFHQNLAKAEQESLHHPVVITDKGKPKHVLMNFVEFQQLLKLVHPKHEKTLFDCFAEGDPKVADIDLEIPPRSHLKVINPFEN